MVIPPECVQATARVACYQSFDESNVVFGQINVVLGDEIIEHHFRGILVLPLFSGAKLFGQGNRKLGIMDVAWPTVQLG